MLSAITAAHASMNQDLQRLHVASENIANIHTIAYKQRVTATEPFSMSLKPNSLVTELLKSHLSIKEVHSEGALRYTGNSSDIAISGPGYFVVKASSGIFYTRQGDFHINSEGFLVTKQGARVQSTDGDIQLENQKFVIDRIGNIWVDQHKVARLDVVNLPIAQLQAMGGGLYKSYAAEQEVSINSTTLQQGFLEMSNVSNVDQMINMMQLSRNFEISQRVLKAYDQMLDMSINHLND